jgi:hypothetical protein
VVLERLAHQLALVVVVLDDEDLDRLLLLHFLAHGWRSVVEG